MWGEMPEELWERVCGHLAVGDVRNVGACCRNGRAASIAALCVRGVTVKDDPRILGASWAKGIRALTVAPVRRSRTVLSTVYSSMLGTVYSSHGADARCALRVLRIRDDRWPAHWDSGAAADHWEAVCADFWDVVFSSCPHLRVVEVSVYSMRDGMKEFCERLVDVGAPRLLELDVRARCAAAWYPGWLPRPAVESATLEKYGASWCRAFTPVNSTALRALTVRDYIPYDASVVPHVLTPAARDNIETVSWKIGFLGLTGDWSSGYAALGTCRRLRHVTIETCPLVHAQVTGVLDGLRDLPATVETLDIDVDTLRMEGKPCHIEWPTDALAHMLLRRLTLRSTFPPTTAADLLGGWMGATPAAGRGGAQPGRGAGGGSPTPGAVFRCEFARTVHRAYEIELEEMVFEVGTDDSDNESIAELRADWKTASARVDPEPMLALLAAHPGLVVEAHNVYVPARHPRFVMTPFRVVGGDGVTVGVCDSHRTG